MRHIIVAAALLLFLSFSPAYADPAPGDACPTADVAALSAGPENSGAGYLMVCQGGTWKAVMTFNNTAQLTKLGNQTCATNEILKFDGTKWACAADNDSGAGSGFPAICSGVTAVGGVCADGTVFAGSSPFDNAPLYVTRCDEGQTWGASCTGTRASVAWNNGSTNYLDIAAMPNNVGATLTNGQTNTAILAVMDCASTAGVQNCAAAKRCADLNISGHDDWFLPAKDELNQLYANRTAIGNFDTGSGTYWSSSENANVNAWYQGFSNGNQSLSLKLTTYYVRCARRD